MSSLLALSQLRFPPAGTDVDDVKQAWRDACTDAHLAFLNWCEATPRAARGAYSVYRAAADREAVAADMLERWSARDAGAGR
jgi:hypothetical protein